MNETVTHSPDETQELATAVADGLLAAKLDRASVVTLRGDLGAGKTTFAQGLLRALGVSDRVTSPTFVLMQRYPLAAGSFKDAYHVDAYRLMRTDDLASLGLDAVLADPKNLVIVEWPEVGGSLFEPTADVALAHGAHPEERRISLTWHA